ncbi:class I SAM-dependent methyltransferase [Candidatus Woesearchaeota archaeon]|nr:class I SAM-dependent methyltransferase [Candidatus Woesearchaeota archaeon]
MILHDHLLHPHTRLLDVGCGTGFYLPLFPCIVIGIDPCSEMLQHCPVSHVVGRAEALPFADNAFDLVISVTAVHHFDDPLKAFTEINRVAKTGIFISILRASPRYDALVRDLVSVFQIKEEIKEDHDVIFNVRKR